jgi:hypothetical protein
MTVVSMLSTTSLPQMDLPDLVDAARDFTRAQNLAAVDRLDAVFAMVRVATARAEEQDRADAEAGRRRRAHERVDPARLVRSHVTTAMGAPAWHAARLVTAAIQLHTRLPRLSRHARDGVMDEALIVDLACRLAAVPDRMLDAVEDEVVFGVRRRLDAGDPPTRGSLGEAIDRAIEGVDPDKVDRQHESAREERRVSFRPTGQGMTSLWGLLPTEDAEALRARLQAAADAAAEPGDPRTAAQRLADALAGLGEDASCGCAGDETSTRAPAGRPRLDITVIAAAAEGLPARVEFVRGAYSSFDWLCAQVLAAENGGARFRVIDPLPGAEDQAQDPMKYLLSEALKRRIRLRDGTCRHPGCRVPAEDCEIDHVLAFNHADPALGGPTAEWNLCCLCKGHHLEKTFGSWIYLPGPRGDGDLIIRTETGHEYRTYPDGMLARARRTLHEETLVRWFRREVSVDMPPPWPDPRDCVRSADAAHAADAGAD